MDRIATRISRILIALVLAFSASGCGNGQVDSLERSLANLNGPPLPGDPEFVDSANALGFYANGSLQYADTFPNESASLLKIFRLRFRGFATQSLIRSLASAADFVQFSFPGGERLQVGDISDHNGGTLGGHASHQNGLDADVIYFRTRPREENPNTDGSDGFPEKFVANGKVTPNFDVARNWAILKRLVLRGNVNRIFVDPAIKRTLCDLHAIVDPGVSLAVSTETLRRLRPYTNHADHFHLRIDCPPNQPRCEPQPDPAPGSGCDAIVATANSDGILATDSADELGEDQL